MIRSMAEKIIIDPLTRISGLLEIEVEVEGNRIVDTKSDGLLYRGFESMLVSRYPLDAIYFTERICGICSVAHSVASAMALEDALQIGVSKNDEYQRDIIHGLEFIQNHLRHFYLMMVPSFVRITNPPIANNQQDIDFRIPEELSRQIEQHYQEGIEYSRLAHEAQAVLGGKAPHNHGVFVGGVNSTPTAYDIEKVRNSIKRLLVFVSNTMREDTEIIASYYPDYYEMGISYPNFLSYGIFNHEPPELFYLQPQVMVDGYRYRLEPDRITEQVVSSWFRNDGTQDQVDLSKASAYSFVKTPQYNGLPMEVGPLARMLISGNYTGGHSCMDRIVARTLEAEKILIIIDRMVDLVELQPSNQRSYLMPDFAQGAGLIDTTRGALGHWIRIQDQVIERYNIIAPSVWNLSPRDERGLAGVVERALIGTMLADVNNPIEIGRIVRSFDPCVSCATHVLRNGRKSMTIRLTI
jgi:hydrogenase large subunit